MLVGVCEKCREDGGELLCRAVAPQEKMRDRLSLRIKGWRCKKAVDPVSRLYQRDRIQGFFDRFDVSPHVGKEPTAPIYKAFH